MAVINERIFNLIKQLNMSYDDVSKLTGIPKSSIHRYATGLRENIPLNKIEVLAKALGTTPEYLMGWEEKKEPALIDGFKQSTELKRIFSSNLFRYMSRTGKTISDLSSNLNLSFSTVSDWVHGKKYPRMDKVQLLADYFGIMKSDLTEESNANTDSEIDSKVSEAQRIIKTLPPDLQQVALDQLRALANLSDNK